MNYNSATAVIMKINRGIIKRGMQILLEWRKITLLGCQTKLTVEWQKLSHEFSRTESYILGALLKLDEIFLNPQSRVHSPSHFSQTNAIPL